MFIDEDGFSMNESRAIAVYLAQKYDKSGKLYPSCIKQQALINNRLAFDMGVYWRSFADCFVPLFFGGAKEVNEDKITRFKEVNGFLEEFLKTTGFVAGTEAPTVADYCILVSYSTADAIKGIFGSKFDFGAFPESQKWFEAMKKTVPNYDTANNVAAFRDLFKQMTGKTPEEFNN